MSRRQRGIRSLNWPLTAKIRAAVREERWIVGPHALGKLMELHLDESDLRHALMNGIVLAKKQKDELRSSIDGYKHFLHGLTSDSMLLEVVFKFVREEGDPHEQLLIVITTYRGRV